MPEAIDSRIVGNAVLERAAAKGRPITNLDLQKIVYFLHGHFLKRHGRPLVRGEFEAWTYGPVHQVLYDAFKKYEDAPIDQPAMAFDPVKRSFRDLPSLSDSDAISVMDDVLDRYLEMPTFTLVRLTHEDGTPWSRTVDESRRKVNLGMRISDSLVAEYFEGTSFPVFEADSRGV